MKKKLLAIAVAGAMAAPAASIAAPTLYGQAHLSLDYISNNNDGAQEANGLRVSSNSSRFGVKGSHDLGGGLAAIYQFEFGVNGPDTGGSGLNLSQRNQFAGIKSDTLGTVVMGRHDTPGKVVGRKADLFWSTQLGQNRALVAGNLSDARASQVIAYISPDFGPVHAFLAYVTDAGGNQNGKTFNDNNAFSGALIYDQNNLFVGLSYDWFNEKIFNQNDAPQNARLAAKWKIADFTVSGLVQYNNNLFASTSGQSDDSQWIFGGGGAWKLGKNTFKGQVYWAAEQDKVDDTEALLVSLGWDHALAKNTQVYVTGGLVQTYGNGSLAAAGYNLGGAGHGFRVGVADDDVEYGVSAGYRILF